MHKLITTLTLFFACLLSFTPVANAQSADGYYKGSFDLNFGGVSPSGDLKTNFGGAPLVGGSLGYRLFRYFQVEGGLDAAFGSARVNNTVQLSGGGTRGTTDREYFLTFGGRGVLPLQKERLLMSFGGGVAVINYKEVPVALPGEQIICGNCGSREGAGSYLVFGIKGMVTPRYGVGLTVKQFQSKTEGDRLDTRLPFKSQDRWLTVAATFSVHW